MNQYKLLSKKGEGTFSEVLKAQSLKEGKFVAIKCMKNHFNSIEQVQRLKEIQALRKVSPHPHIIKLIEVLYDEPTGRLALVFELMDQNLYEAIRGKKQYLNQQKVKFYMYQLLKAIDHMHKKGIFHRDIKPENILLLGDHVKLADFGSCKGIYSEHPYTEYISTRWYRAPECLLTDGYYSSKMDLWGVGCVMFEVMSLFPLFPGNDELDQAHKIHNVLGTPNPKILEQFQKHATHMELNFPPKKGTGIEKLAPHIPKDCIDLIYKLLSYDPEERITAEQALQHPYFRDLYQMDQENQLLLQSTITSKTKLSPSNNSNMYNRTLPENQLNLNQSTNNNTNNNHTNSTTKLEVSPQHHDSQYQSKNLNTMKIYSQISGQGGQNNSSNSNLNNTTKYNPYRESAENVFYPVLTIKKATNPYHKKKGQQQAASMKKTQHQQYPSFNLNLKIESNYKDSGTDEDADNNNRSKPQFLPPIKNQMNPNHMMQMDPKVNMMKGQNSVKQKQNNQYPPYKQKKSKKFNEEYLVLGKKPVFNKQ
ncbi:hypothetical protein ABPG74_004151 [Tetrahymena malaccensis]